MKAARASKRRTVLAHPSFMRTVPRVQRRLPGAKIVKMARAGTLRLIGPRDSEPPTSAQDFPDLERLDRPELDEPDERDERAPRDEWDDESAVVRTLRTPGTTTIPAEDAESA